MKLFENGVGRPSNEIKKKRRDFIGNIISVVVMVLAVGYFAIFEVDVLDLKGAATKKVQTTDFVIKGPTSNKLYMNKTGDFDLNVYYKNKKQKDTKYTWSSTKPKIATVDKNGKVKAVGLGRAKITAKAGEKIASYTVEVRQKNIVVITASLGDRMKANYTKHSNEQGFYYTTTDHTLKYVNKGGEAFDWQVKIGTPLAINGYKKLSNEGITWKDKRIEFDKENPNQIGLNELYKKNEREFIDLSVFYTLSGNKVNDYTCDEILTKNDYVTWAATYNEKINEFINAGYKNTKGYIVSHSPMNTAYVYTNKNADPNKAKGANIVYSTDKTACDTDVRSNYKYYLSNYKMKKVIKDGKYSNLTFINYFDNVIKLDSKSKADFKKIENYITNASKQKPNYISLRKTFDWQKKKIVVLSEKYKNYYYKINGKEVKFVEAKKNTSYKNIVKANDGLHWEPPTTIELMKLLFKTAGM